MLLTNRITLAAVGKWNNVSEHSEIMKERGMSKDADYVEARKTWELGKCLGKCLGLSTTKEEKAIIAILELLRFMV